MTYDEALCYIHSREKLPSAGSLPRMEALLQKLGHPERSLSFIHITGTNGKGSAAQLFSRALTLSGRRTGLFTSPFILDFRERMQIDGEMISKEALTALVERLSPVVAELAGEGIGVSEFELDAALAFCWFAERRCGAVVLEVGIGGAHDATNVIPPPLLSVIMGVGLDHQQLLGETVGEIAAEKAGIIKGNPVVSYPFQEPEAVAALMERCAVTGSTLHLPNPREVQLLREDLAGTDFSYGGARCRLTLLGRHQVYNAVTFMEGARLLGLPFRAVREAMDGAALPARMELVRKAPPVLLDGAHNPHGMKALAESLSHLWRGGITAVIGMLGDKERGSALSCLAPLCSRIYAVPVDNPRTASAADTAALAAAFCPETISCRDWREGVRQALREGGDGLLLICGSLYLASDARRMLLEEEPELLKSGEYPRAFLKMENRRKYR